MLVNLLKTEKEKFKNEMNIQQENLNSELLIAKDVQRNLQGPAQIWNPWYGPSRTVLVGQKFWSIQITSLSVILHCTKFCTALHKICTAQNLHCTKFFALHKICGITRSIRAIFKDENFENIRFSLEERRNHVTLVCQNMTYETTFWEEHNGTNFVDVPSKLGFISIIF